MAKSNPRYQRLGMLTMQPTKKPRFGEVVLRFGEVCSKTLQNVVLLNGGYWARCCKFRDSVV